MLGFGKKAKKKKWVVEASGNALCIQMRMGRSVGAEKYAEQAKDMFFHGYIFGYIDALLQRAGIDDQKESLGVMQQVHEQIFYSGVGIDILELHLEFQGNPTFISGMFKGGGEADAFLDEGDMPMGLASFIQTGEE